ncbi:hypothetical protein CPC08DRAFT_729507 [Agrocybe pediades]|nr:hypothetical protein CPC08DRAFT_729507 [Agrocybe pediades]
MDIYSPSLLKQSLQLQTLAPNQTGEFRQNLILQYTSGDNGGTIRATADPAEKLNLETRPGLAGGPKRSKEKRNKNLSASSADYIRNEPMVGANQDVFDDVTWCGVEAVEGPFTGTGKVADASLPLIKSRVNAAAAERAETQLPACHPEYLNPRTESNVPRRPAGDDGGVGKVAGATGEGGLMLLVGAGALLAKPVGEQKVTRARHLP